MKTENQTEGQPQVATSAVVCDAATPCPECGCTPPGHRINCKTGNAKAKAYQDGLERRYRASRSHTVPALAQTGREKTTTKEEDTK